MVYQDVFIERKPFVWRTLQEHNETNDAICRNSVQGKSLLVDDRGNKIFIIIDLLFVFHLKCYMYINIFSLFF